MNLLIRTCAALALTLSLPLAAAPAPLHSQFLPSDDLTLRAEAPDQQQLLQVTEYAVVVGNQRQSSQQPIPVTSPLMIRLKGKPLNKGATISQVVLNFDAESKSLKSRVYTRAKHSTCPTRCPYGGGGRDCRLLRNTVYVQFLVMPRAYLADLHTGAVRARY